MSARMRPDGQFIGSGEGAAQTMAVAERALAAGAPASLDCKLKHLVSVSYTGDLDAAIMAAQPYAHADHGVRGVLSLFCVDGRQAIENLKDSSATKRNLEALSRFGAVILAGDGAHLAQQYSLDEYPRIIAISDQSEQGFVAGYEAVEEFLFEDQPLPVSVIP